MRLFFSMIPKGSDENMAQIKAGDEIGIKCEVKPGPFPGEHLIEVETLDGPVSGFVSESFLKETDGVWFVRGTVYEVFSDHMKVRIKGSFFTTNGIANITSTLAMAA
jgi:hypothetical protein